MSYEKFPENDNCPYCGENFDYTYSEVIEDDFDNDNDYYLLIWSVTCQNCQRDIKYRTVYKMIQREFIK